MKWLSIYLVGYLLVLGGLFLALSEWGILHEIGPLWTLISVMVGVGIGVMIAVSSSGRKESITIDSH